MSMLQYKFSENFPCNKANNAAVAENILRPTILKSLDPEIVYPQNVQNLSDFIQRILEKWHNSPFLECGITGRVYTYGEVLRKSRTFASNLKKLPGIEKGTVVALILSNSLEFVIAMLGSWEAGCILCPLNPLLTQREIALLLKNCGAKCVIVDSSAQLNFLKEHDKEKSLTSIKSIVIVNDEMENAEFLFGISNTKHFSSMLHEVCEDNDIFEPSKYSDVAALLYTSGTTGNPKGIQQTHLNLISISLQCSRLDDKRKKEVEKKCDQDIIIFVLPLCHMYGLCILMMSMNLGAKAIIFPKYNAETYVQAIIQHKPTMYHAVPVILHSMIKNSALKMEHLSMTHTVSYSAAPMNDYILQKFIDKFGDHIFVRQMYGMSEMAVVLSIDSGYGNTKRDSIGRLVPSAIAKVVCCSTGNSLGPNELGELCIKGPNVMKGYLNNEVATKQTIDSDGFLHTGDLVRYDKDGWFYIVDRIKDIIKVNGYHVSPSEIEEQLLKLEGITDVAVIGVPHESTETPRAYVVSSRVDLSKEEICSHVKSNLAPYKRLSGGIEFVKDIPRSPSGKILKRNLLQSYLANQ